MIFSAQEFISLIESKETSENARARFDSASEEIWFEIIQTFPDYYSSVIQNKTIPINVLHFFAKMPDPNIRWEVAMKRKLDFELFDLLSQDSEEIVRLRIANNKKTPIQILKKLVSDESPIVSEVAQKRLDQINVK